MNYINGGTLQSSHKKPQDFLYLSNAFPSRRVHKINHYLQKFNSYCQSLLSEKQPLRPLKAIGEVRQKSVETALSCLYIGIKVNLPGSRQRRVKAKLPVRRLSRQNA
jgi:hypothetical protein